MKRDLETGLARPLKTGKKESPIASLEIIKGEEKNRSRGQFGYVWISTEVNANNTTVWLFFQVDG